MSDKSGWCSGWGPKHDGCKWALCRCSCHGETAARQPTQQKGKSHETDR